MTAHALALVCLAAGLAAAEPDGDAERAFAAASARMDIDAFEALGAARPITRWSDNAWSEAARLAELAGDFARARRDLEQVIAVGTDDKLVERAKATLARLTAATGGGTWDGVAREHARLVADIHDGGDPRNALAALEQLDAAYPQHAQVLLAIAQGWEIEGETARAMRWYREALAGAPAGERQRVGFAMTRAQIRHRELDAARATLDALAAAPNADAATIDDLRRTLAAQEQRAIARIVMWIVLAALVVFAIAIARRDAGSWRALGGLAKRPPGEALFLAPIAVLLVVIAQTGNPLVGGAVTIIAIAAVAITYGSGVSLEAARAGGVTRWRIALHAFALVVAVGASVYLAVDRGRVIDLIAETWEHGPER